jgi:adenylate cyclase
MIHRGEAGKMSFDAMLRKTRLVSGLVLMAFVTSHLANLAIGLRSLEAMEAWRTVLLAPWQTAWGETLLGASALVHAALGLYAIAARRSLAMSRTDVAQLVLGLLTPPLLLAHVLAMRVTAELAPDFDASYSVILSFYWSYAPFYAFQQLFVVVIIWIHAALGLYSWLVLKPLWRRTGAFVLPLLFAVPILALLGFAESGKEVLAKLAQDADWRAGIEANLGLLAQVEAELDRIQYGFLLAYAGLALLAMAVLALRILRDRSQRVSITYDGGLVATGRRGLSVLELSRLNGVPHAHVCSGRARCGTCRVRVEGKADLLTPPTDLERGTLERVHAGEGVRLACQARVLGGGLAVTRLLPAYADASAARAPEDWAGEADPAAPKSAR